jgi:glycosyltransferase involved in cell wall biosynthesis
VRQYIPKLKQLGVDMTEFVAVVGAYPPANRLLRPWWAVTTLTSRLPGLVRSFRFDLTFLQREFLSTFVTFEPFLHQPRILDVDDAIWVHRRGSFAKRLARECNSVICGNQFLADNFSRWNPNVTVIATGVDTQRFHPVRQKENGQVVIGWSGTSANYGNLAMLEAPLAVVLHEYPNVHFRIVSDQEPTMKSLPREKVEYTPWSPNNEIETIQTMDIGVMPLEDTVFARGKCSYKMLLYMACGIPVVVSPVGMNQDVLDLGSVGFGARNDEEWVDALRYLIGDESERKRIGMVGRTVVESNFSLERTSSALANWLLAYA